MFCPNCAAQLADGSAFCPNCGKNLEGATPPAQSAPPAQPYQAAPAYQATPAATSGSKGKALASMICGIAGIVFGCCLWYIGLPAAIVGLILGIMSLRNKEDGHGMALAGVIMCGVALLLAIITAIAGAVILSSIGFNWSDYIN